MADMRQEKLQLLKSLHLLDKLSESQLEEWGKFLKPHKFADRAVIFEEGSPGESLYFISSGRVLISKRLFIPAEKAGAPEELDLAVLGPGDCFGEMALAGKSLRSARAAADGAAVIFELTLKDLAEWIKIQPQLALGFFSLLIEMQSKRLRHTSNELTIFFDLSSLFLETTSSSNQLLTKALALILPHLKGSWAGAAYLYNPFNEEMDCVAGFGDYDFKQLAAKLPPLTEIITLWIDNCFYVSFPGPTQPYGYLLFRCTSHLTDQEQAEMGRTLTTVARLLTSALENINFRREESFRTQLKKTSYGAIL